MDRIPRRDVAQEQISPCWAAGFANEDEAPLRLKPQSQSRTSESCREIVSVLAIR